MKIVSWNVNGIRAVAKKGFAEFLSRYQPDLLCIQESKAHPDQVEPELLNPFGYKSFWSSADRPGYSGTLIYSKREPIDVKFGIGIRKYDREGRFVIASFSDFIVYNIYFPNGSSGFERHTYKQNFLTDLNDHLRHRLEVGIPIIVLGDFNVAHQDIDVFDPAELSDVSGFLREERRWFGQFLDLGFTDVYRQMNPNVSGAYTWWNYIDKSRLSNRGWRLDYICVSNHLVNKVKSAEILSSVMGSDHCPVSVDLD